MKLISQFLISFILVFVSSAVLSETNNLSSQKIKLGFIVPLTGPLGFFGTDLVRAVDLAIEEAPEIKNHIEMFWEDSAYDSKQAISVFNKLVEVNKVDIVYSFGGPMLSALAPIAERRKIPFFASESSKIDCAGRAYCSLFRNEEDEWGKAYWEVLRENNIKNLLIIKNQNQFMNTFVEAIERTKNSDEKVDIFLDVPDDNIDFRSSVLPLRNKSFDALGVFLLPRSHHGLMQSLKMFNKKFHFIGVEEFLVPEQNKGLEHLMEKVMVLAPSSTERYQKRFEEAYGYSAGFFYTPACYDFVMLLKDTVKKNSDLRGLELVNAMRFEGERKGVSGTYHVKQSPGEVFSYSFPIGLYEVENGKGVLKKNITFPYHENR
jgi:ABC-type branched-subunit amino acid transport system substrate-binding protein